MRGSYGMRMLECMSDLGVDASSIKDVVDMGCATGEARHGYWHSASGTRKQASQQQGYQHRDTSLHSAHVKHMVDLDNVLMQCGTVKIPWCGKGLLFLKGLVVWAVVLPVSRA